jgi:hypothetical protein
VRHYCIVPKCENPGRHAVTLRVRRPDSSAIIAPNTGAYLCDEHAESATKLISRSSRTTRGKPKSTLGPSSAGVQGHVERAVTLIENPAEAGREGEGSKRCHSQNHTPSRYSGSGYLSVEVELVGADALTVRDALGRLGYSDFATGLAALVIIAANSIVQ